MSLDVETVLERRRLRKQVGWWRGLAILAGVIVLIAWAAMQARESGILARQQIARVSIEGMITDDRKQLELIEKIAEADHVAGVIVHVNSPGGTTTGGEGLYLALRDLAAKKPVVAQFGTVAASAAYIVGLATDHIVARGNTITGSVGVIVQWPEVSGLLDKIGVRMNTIKSGPLKAEPSPFGPISPEAQEVTKTMIEEGQRWFVGLVEERRGVTATNVPGLTAGRVYSGRMAHELKLVDTIGGEDEAVAWMVRERGVKEGLDVVDWKPEESLPWPGSSALAMVWSVITGQASHLLPSSAAIATIGLDGLISVWHPQEN